MSNKPIVIVPGHLKSVFFEIFFKSIRIKKFNSPLILICSANSFRINAKRYNFKGNFKLIEAKINNLKLYKKNIYIIDVKIKKNKNKKIQEFNNNNYILKCFNIAFKILESAITYKFLNGPINKKKFLNKRYLGVTEFLAEKFKIKKIGMLIYNKNLSVCPLTTHLPVNLISKKIKKELLVEKLRLINDFYLKIFKFKPKIGVTGLNPHCESIIKNSEEDEIIIPAIKLSKMSGVFAYGPYAADTIFLKQNRKKFDVILGMYHDQVLTPIKTLFEYDAVNITMGLPFLRVSPDHGPNEKMVNKNLSNPTSLIKALEFLDKH